MTYPEIGNYGVNEQDIESSRPHARGFVVKDFWDKPSNWRSTIDLGTYLKKHGVVGIDWIDTRAITRKIRNDGAQRCVISTEDLDIKSLLKKVKSYPSITGRDIVEILGNGDLKAVKLDTGKVIACCILVIAKGVVPNVDLVRDTQINIDKGILVDEYMKTNITYDIVS